MPAAGASIRCLILLRVLGRSLAFEDVAALFQQRQAVAALEPLPAELLPHPGSDGLHVSRVSASGENGSSIVLNYTSIGHNLSSTTCEQDGPFGPKECVLYYGEPVYKTYSVHLANGVGSGDVIREAYRFDLQHNASSFWSFLVPKTVYVAWSCGICGGTCSLSTTTARFSLNVTSPASWDDSPLCASLGNSTAPPQETLAIDSSWSFLLKPPADLALQGTVNMTAAVVDAHGNDRARASWVFRMLTSTPAAMLARGIEGLGQPPLGALDLLGEMLLDSAGEVFDLSGSEGSSGSGLMLADVLSNHSYGLVLNMTVRSIAAGSSIGVSFERFCTAQDTHGSIACLLPFNETISFTPHLNLSYTASEGSTVYSSSKASVAGALPTLFPNGFKKREMTLPLCGNETVTVTNLKGVRKQYSPGKCGFHSIAFAALQPEIQTLPPIKNFDLPHIPFMPFLPKTFDSLLPLTEVSELVMRHHDNTTILSLQFGVGITKM
mmetsp:Transcript_75327/g.232992  ORF Transcript_75327/g.232992 Transcript_75327/m.232992 type:complete len:494 (-) Transcript_75327:51-1532(-)|eukprot:CAMPEP_0204560196 /NCGR_PEP_ID=MMETSP0661-20131031/32470_1 /ASSEMBLY_ACC=CAM_ASM_000606 /TAXON_ID=109239 /ORGANISM="Alexandrium margalefi, Strain AMGDE01CS-322" /LENGTH=493 /DNA_ID=CAMNT_0051567501 /DNA_START=55 /DNA_END=1536 /DNA_ORIENTATION=-